MVMTIRKLFLLLRYVEYTKIMKKTHAVIKKKTLFFIVIIAENVSFHLLITLALSLIC